MSKKMNLIKNIPYAIILLIYLDIAYYMYINYELVTEIKKSNYNIWIEYSGSLPYLSQDNYLYSLIGLFVVYCIVAICFNINGTIKDNDIKISNLSHLIAYLGFIIGGAVFIEQLFMSLC